MDPAREGTDDGSKERAARHGAIAETLGGEWREARGHRYVVVDRRYGPGYRHGHIAVMDAMPSVDGMWPHLDLLSGAQGFQSRVAPRCAESTDSPGCGAEAADGPGRGLLFVDLETTGLAGGAGTYAFLVGCAWFDGAAFRIRQLLLSSFGAEAALLEEVASLAASAAGLVTYNGKSFDVPLLETRFALNRMPATSLDLPHLDMLHPARRLWKHPATPGAAGPRGRDDEGSAAAHDGGRGAESSCRLVALERTQCGFTREGDMPGFEIPSRYFSFVRSGDARPLEAVLEHNRLDLISLAMITWRASCLLERGAGSARTAREALGLGRLFESGGRPHDARRCYARAAGLAVGDAGLAVGAADPAGGHGIPADVLSADPVVRSEALRGFALVSRRIRAYADAAMAWTCVLEIRDCPAHITREATEALAVHHEHRLRDVGAARAFALRSLATDATRARRDALEYRLARLNRKIGQERWPLFSQFT